MLCRVRFSRFQCGWFGVLAAVAGATIGCGDGDDVSSASPKGRVGPLPEIDVWRGPARFQADPDPIDVVAADDDPNALYTNVYQVAPSFPNHIANNDAGQLFGSAAPRSAREVLEAYGITFGPGAAVIQGSRSGQLVVRQTADQMALVEAVLESLAASQPRNLHFRLEIYQVPSSYALQLLKSAESEGDHRGEWEATLGLLEEGIAEFVTALTLSSRSGQRSRAVDGRDWTFTTAGAFETREVGTSLEVDPVVGADGETVQVSVTVEHHTALPSRKLDSEGEEGSPASETHVFHAKTIQAEVTMANTHAKLIGSWRPTGRPEFEEDGNVMQIAFLKVDLQPLHRIEREP